MKTIKGPALFLAQFAGDAAPFNSWKSITTWAADCGYVGVQVPSWDGRLFDLEKAATSKTYCDEFKGMATDAGIEVTELSTHLQGQLVAVHPAYDTAFDGFAAPTVRGNPKARQEWAVDQVKKALTRLEKPWPDRPCHLLGRPRLALSLPLAAAPGRSGGRGLRRTRPPLDADPGPRRRLRHRRLLRNPPRRRPA